MVALEPGGLIGHHGVTHSVGLVEGVVGKIVDFIVDRLGNSGGYSVVLTADNIPLRVPVDKGSPLPLNILHFLFRHGAAHHVGLSQRVTCQLLEDLNDLLLVDDTSIGIGQDGLQGRVLIGNLVRIVFAGNKAWNGIHGARAVEGDDGGDILDILWLEAEAHPGHSRRLHLEHTGGLPL